jgi:membrane-associated phospholipid phosphatase
MSLVLLGDQTETVNVKRLEGLAHRIRVPRATLKFVNQRDHTLRWAKSLAPDCFSFPSSRSLPAFAVAISLARFYPKLATLPLFWGISIAASRVLLGMQVLSDVMLALGAAKFVRVFA